MIRTHWCDKCSTVGEDIETVSFGASKRKGIEVD